MPEQFHPQPTPENTNKETLLKELLSEKTRQDLLNYVKRYIKGTSSEDAEDVVQKILFKATRAINNNKFIDGSKLKSWLGTIAHHATVDLLKKRGRRFDTGSLDKELEKNGYEPSYPGLLDQDKVMLKKDADFYLGKLEPKHRQVMELAAEGLTYPEIAARLGIHAITVGSRMYRAREILKKFTKEDHKK